MERSYYDVLDDIEANRRGMDFHSWRCSCSDNPKVRMVAAESTSSSENTLEDLSHDSDPQVAAVARLALASKRIGR